MTSLIATAFREVEDRVAGQRKLSEPNAAVILLIDHVSTAGLTNRPSAIDPAVARRAAQIFEFQRPNDEQRRAIFERAFAGTGIADEDLHMLGELTGHVDGERQYGHTYSDLTMRLIPSAVLDAFPDSPLTAARVAELIAHNPPTGPFGNRADD